MQDFRLLVPAGVVWAMAILAPDYLVLGLAALLVTLAGTLRRNWFATIVGVALIAASMCGTADALVRESDAVRRVIGEDVQVSGTIERHPKASGGRYGVMARIETVARWEPGKPSGPTMSSQAILYLRWEGERLERGTRFVARGRMSADGLEAASIEVLSTPATGRLRSLLREAVADRPWHAQLIPGVVVGDDTGLPQHVSEQMRVLSLSHLTAVSGAHVSLAIAVVLGAVGRRRPLMAGMLALVSLAGLVELVGPEASVLRAGYMGVLMCVAIALRRRSNALPLLSATIIGVSLLDLELARSLGFQLSALATLAIIVFSYPLQRRLAEHLPGPIADVVSISLIAAIATAPPLLAIQERASMWGILANALVAPVVAPLTIGGMVGALLLPVAPWLAAPILRACEACTWWMAKVTSLLIALPGSSLPTFAVLAANLVFLIALLLGLAFGGVRVILGAAAVLAFAAIVSGLVPQRGAGDWEAIQCDVGQGSAFLGRTQAGVVLVDVGPEGANIPACLQLAGVTRIDLLIISHFDADHVRGLKDVLDAAEVGEVWYSSNLYHVYNSSWALDLLDRRGIEHRPVGYGQSAGGIRVVGPRSVIGTDDSTNADSLVVEMTTPSHRILILADAPGERQLALRSEVEDIDVVVAGHHGARDQSRELAEQVRAAVTIFSVGKDNTYGHPTREALQIWHAPIQVRTDLCGPIVLRAAEVASGCRMDVE
ncbi:ComEC/Rec2 family competence protein [Trueperella abortisuis]|uniref:Competence protein ComEC n=1 Tax=Trueperella abortisuis TaxID=445930 RepID=A0ABT9PJK4_9ACTO|nr:ComEC/Rec2 family competence protein [Trueperella abortisuis]MDP9832574.1 competence protein ComEC [Trueperella abortisuis]